MIENVDGRTERRIRRGQTIRIVVVLIAMAVLVWWGIANTGDVEVDWIVGTTTGPLVFVIAAAAVVGFLLGFRLARRARAVSLLRPVGYRALNGIGRQRHGDGGA